MKDVIKRKTAINAKGFTGVYGCTDVRILSVRVIPVGLQTRSAKKSAALGVP